MNDKTKIKQVQAISRGIEAVYRVCPIIEAPKIVLVGLSEIINTKSSIINPTHQRQLKGVLNKNVLNYYYISLKSEAKVPKQFKHLFYKNELKAEDPNQIKPLNVEGFKFWSYAIQTLDHDNNGFYFIVHKKDIVKFLIMIRKANELTKYQIESRKADYERIEEEAEYLGLKHSYEYDKIFKMEDYERKMLFIYLKEAGLNKTNRTLLKRISKGRKSFYVMLEELEELIDSMKGEEIAINELEEAEHMYLSFTEEDNSWNNLEENIEDYWYY